MSEKKRTSKLKLNRKKVTEKSDGNSISVYEESSIIRNNSSKQVPNVKIESIDQIHTVDTSKNEVTLSMDVFLYLIQEFPIQNAQQQCETTSILSTNSKPEMQKNPLQDISNVIQNQLKEVTRESHRSTSEFSIEIDVEEDPVYVPKVKTDPFSVDIVKKKLLLAPSFPAKPVSDCKVRAQRKKHLLIKNLNQYAETFQKTTQALSMNSEKICQRGR